MIDISDETAPAHRYLAASREYAGAGEGHRAVLTMCAADLAVVQQLLRAAGADDAPEPADQLAPVGEAVIASLTGLGPELGGGADAFDVVDRFRRGLVATFDESVHEILNSRLLPVEHLRGLAPRGEATSGHETDDFLAGRTPAELVSDLQVATRDCAVVAEILHAEGDIDGALRQMWQSDLAAFEAYLVTTAVRTGDVALSTVALRWDLARSLVLGPADDAEDFAASVTAWRSALTEVVSPAEAAALHAFFVPVPVE